LEGVNLAAAALHVPPGPESLYQAAPVWREFGSLLINPLGNETVRLASALRVYTLPGSLYVSPSASCTLYIYTLSGTLVKRLPASAGETVSVALPKGLYIVRAGTETAKAAVR
jgi:hypothetical protein